MTIMTTTLKLVPSILVSDRLLSTNSCALRDTQTEWGSEVQTDSQTSARHSQTNRHDCQHYTVTKHNPAERHAVISHGHSPL